MGMVIIVLIAPLAIIFLVITHELGHFLAARWAGVKTPEFFVGFGKRIWSTRRGDTEFGFKWILAGGYVKVLGMNPEEEISPEDFPHSYKGVSYRKRFWIIFSGSLVHVFLALLIMFFTIWLIGYPNLDKATSTLASVGRYMEVTQQDGTTTGITGLQDGDTVLAMDGQPVSDRAVVSSYLKENPDQEVTLLIERDGQEMEVQARSEESPAYAAGLREGDTILEMNGQPAADWDEVSSFIKDHPGQEVTILIERDDQKIEVQARLATREDGTGYLGVSPKVYMEQYSFLGAAGKTGEWFVEASWGVFYGVYRVFNLSTFKQLLGISEPTPERPQTFVGITRTASQFFGEGLFYFLNFFAFICLFLAYINLAPLPPLDGGHLAVLAYERITGREVDIRKLYPVAVAVLAFFAVMFILTLRLDITNPINLP